MEAIMLFNAIAQMPDKRDFFHQCSPSYRATFEEVLADIEKCRVSAQLPLGSIFVIEVLTEEEKLARDQRDEARAFEDYGESLDDYGDEH